MNRMDLDTRINRAIDRSLDGLAGRIGWLLVSVAVMAAVIYFLAAIIGGW